jgi:hypothetical protein
VPRRDCSAPRGCNWSCGDHHAARRIAHEQKHLAGKRALEASPRLDRSTDDDELCPALRGDPRDVLAERSRPRPDDLAAHADAVGGRHRGRRFEALPQAGEFSVEVRVQR